MSEREFFGKIITCLKVERHSIASDVKIPDREINIFCSGIKREYNLLWEKELKGF